MTFMQHVSTALQTLLDKIYTGNLHGIMFVQVDLKSDSLASEIWIAGEMSIVQTLKLYQDGHFLNLFIWLKKILKESPDNSHLSLWEKARSLMQM